jgi:broad specificity phosphatase PhoE
MFTRITRWWWVRHAPVTVNNGRVYGADDLDCETDDEAAFRGLAAILPPDAALVVSTLRRTHQTVDAIRRAGLALPAQPVVEHDFREQSFGDWQGLPYEDFLALRAAQRHAHWLAPAHERAPNGESFEDLRARVARGIVRHGEAFRGRDIVAVAHGGVIKAAIGHALGCDSETALVFAVANCSVTVLEEAELDSGGAVWRVATINRPPHQH